jgi:hypothetical protein
MWDQLKRTDIELAKQKLAELRNVTLQRHAEELKQLDSDERDVDMLGRLVEGFANKYLNSGTQSDEQATPAEDLARRPEAEPEEPTPATLEGRQHVSPNFAGPLRRFVGR